MNFNLVYKGQLLYIYRSSFCHQKSHYCFLFSGDCRALAFPSYFLIADKCLESHTILIVQHVPDMGLCELLCYNQPNCVSVNYEIQTQRRCELNNSTHRAHDADFKEREGCLYHGATVSFLFSLFLSFFLLWSAFIIFKAMDHYLIIVIIITRDGVFVIRSERLLKKLTQAVSKFISLIFHVAICQMLVNQFGLKKKKKRLRNRCPEMWN